jgi:DNA-binding transcriptional LysR family regulator
MRALLHVQAAVFAPLLEGISVDQIGAKVGVLVIPDPNVRVQAVIDGQGVALYDRLVDDEVAVGRLYQYSAVALQDYGYYLLFPRATEADSAISIFRDWIMQEAQIG